MNNENNDDVNLSPMEDSNTEGKQLPEENLRQLEHIIMYENRTDKNYILRPLSAFHVHINWYYQYDPDKKATRKGLALCHGHNYSNEVTSKLRFIINWYYVDGDKMAYPDYVADATNEYLMNYFPDNYFDAVLSVYCPVWSYYEQSKNNYPLILKNVHRILKKNGLMCFTELPKLIFWFIPEEDFKEIINKINEIVSKENVEEFKKEVIGDDPEMIPERNLYQEIMLNYLGDEKLTQYVESVSLHHTKRFLQEHNFEFVGIKSMFLFAKPIK